MKVVPHFPATGWPSQRLKLVTVVSVFFAVLGGMLIFTITTLQHGKKDALIIDIAGSQRMLIQRYMKEVIVDSHKIHGNLHGIYADYNLTRIDLLDTLDLLENGGLVARTSDPRSGEFQLDPIYDSIRPVLSEQRALISQLFDLSQTYLQTQSDDPLASSLFKEFLNIGQQATDVADKTVILLVKDLESEFSDMIVWEAVIGVLALLIVIVLTRQVAMSGQGLEHEVMIRQEAETALERIRRQNELILNSAGEGIFGLDAKGLITFINPAAARMVGCEVHELLDTIQPRLMQPTKSNGSPYPWVESPIYATLTAGQQRHVTDDFFLKKDGTSFPVEYVSSPIQENGEQVGAVVVFRDKSEFVRAEERRKKFEEKLQQAQKLESLGVLAGGIAHDFNNLLMGILGNAGLVLMELPEEGAARESVEHIELAAKRAAELTNQMLAYSGRGKFFIEAINLSKLVQEMAQLLDTVISKKAVLQFDLQDDLPAIEGDATQLRQIFMNLITNASDAIGEEAGAITVSSGVMELNRSELAAMVLDEELPPGSYIYAEVTDTGCGMDEETAAKIFDPFYSTKFTGRGLGLAAVLGIVRGHHGVIHLKSEVGRGTTFRVMLPCSQTPEDAMASQPHDPRQFQGSGTVLVIDDDEAVLVVMERMLKKFGYEVLAAIDGQAGIDMFRQHHDEVIVVLLDLTMPKMNAEEVFRELTRIRADANVILCSGYNEEAAMSEFSGENLAGFLQKPFLPVTLFETINKVLSA